MSRAIHLPLRHRLIALAAARVFKQSAGDAIAEAQRPARVTKPIIKPFLPPCSKLRSPPPSHHNAESSPSAMVSPFRADLLAGKVFR
jgi:hypothetical protein